MQYSKIIKLKMMGLAIRHGLHVIRSLNGHSAFVFTHARGNFCFAGIDMGETIQEQFTTGIHKFECQPIIFSLIMMLYMEKPIHISTRSENYT